MRGTCLAGSPALSGSSWSCDPSATPDGRSLIWCYRRSGVSIPAVDVPVELPELRYFVAVAEELHFGRAAQRPHMSQSPLSRAIRDLERELGVVLFVRMTWHVELTPAGFALLERARRALAEIDGAMEEAWRAARPDRGVLTVGYGPLSRAAATRVVEALASARPTCRSGSTRTRRIHRFLRHRTASGGTRTDAA
jgi:DNA-binding transcriptional LysR family regulator